MTAISARGGEIETRGLIGPERQPVAKHRRFDRATHSVTRLGNDSAARLEQPRPDIGNGFDEAGFEPELSDLIGDEDVGALGQLGHRRMRVHEPHAILEAVRGRDGAGQPHDCARLDAVDARGSRAAGEQAEDARARCQINHHVARAGRRHQSHGPGRQDAVDRR